MSGYGINEGWDLTREQAVEHRKKDDITVCIATIPPRAKMLRKAINSVLMQTHQAQAIIIESDPGHTGAAATKNRALAKATTEWVAFLDDDDQFLPEHLDTLLHTAWETDADVVYSIPLCPQLPGGRDPHGRYGVPFDADELRKRSYIQTTSLIRRAIFQRSGGFQLPDQKAHPGCVYDDWGGWLALLEIGATFVHEPTETFIWNHHGVGQPGVPGNTSGRPDRW